MIMEAIYIPKLAKAPDKTEAIKVDEFIADLETLTPVRGSLGVKHQGNYLEVAAKAETIITLTCDRCLNQYNHRLKINTSELIWLDKAVNESEIGSSREQEFSLEDLVETLPPQGYFHPSTWLYEQLCLAIPLRNLCDLQCPGIQFAQPDTSEPLSDSRWASLEALKNYEI